MPTQKKKPSKVKGVKHPLEYALKLKDPLWMFDLCMSSAYFAGRFDMPIPVEETRKVFYAIKKLL